MTDIAIIGGGISGLAAAWEAAGRGADVVVLETDRQVGGKLRTSPFAGVELDEAADAFLARVPEGVELCTELGLDGDFVSPTTGSAFVLTERGLRRLPPEQLLGVPTDLDALEAADILSADGLARAREDLDAPHDNPGGDESVAGGWATRCSTCSSARSSAARGPPTATASRCRWPPPRWPPPATGDPASSGPPPRHARRRSPPAPPPVTARSSTRPGAAWDGSWPR